MRMQYPVTIPELVFEQRRLAAKLGFDLWPEGNRAGSTSSSGPSACLDEVGSLLRTLTAALPAGRIAEVGTGAGIGSGWIASVLQPATGPFDLDFFDGGGPAAAAHSSRSKIAALLKPNRIMVIDDLTPESQLPGWAVRNNWAPNQRLWH